MHATRTTAKVGGGRNGKVRVQAKGKGFGPSSRPVDGSKPTIPTKVYEEPPRERKKNTQANDTETMPPVVSDRILRRALGFCTTPLVVTETGIWISATQLNEEQRLPPTALGPLTLMGTVLAALGLTYGALSASWDPKREGTLLGWEEWKRNLQATRENRT